MLKHNLKNNAFSNQVLLSEDLAVVFERNEEQNLMIDYLRDPFSKYVLRH